MISVRQICADMVFTQHQLQQINGIERRMNTGQWPASSRHRAEIAYARASQHDMSHCSARCLIAHAAANDSHVNAEVS